MSITLGCYWVEAKYSMIIKNSVILPLLCAVSVRSQYARSYSESLPLWSWAHSASGVGLTCLVSSRRQTPSHPTLMKELGITTV